MIHFEQIGPQRDIVLRNLYEHYVHDMSEWLGLEVQVDGRFAYDTAPLWVGDFAVYLAQADDKLAGFAVVSSAEKWTGDKASRDVKDFFVLRAHRHSGVASAMARFIWERQRAAWIVRVLATNKPAVPFWRRAVRDYAGVDYREDVIAEQGKEWIHIRFDNRSVER